MTKNPRVAEALAPLKLQFEAEKAEILFQSAPLHEQRESLVAKIQPLEAALRNVDAQIDAIENPRLRNVGNELAAIARQIGAITLVNDGEAKSE